LTSEKKTYEKYLRQRDKQHNELLTEREHLGKQLQEYRFALTTLQKEYGNLVKELSDVPTGFLVKENYEKYIHAVSLLYTIN
jgi:chromosome segregation ATPase